MLRILFIIIILISETFAQVFTEYADSLMTVLPGTEDEERVVILKELSWEIRMVDPQLSLYYAEEGIKLADDLNLDKLKATLLNIMGVTHTVLGNFDKALEYHFQSLSIREANNDTLGLSASLNNIGVVYETSENYEKALEFYLKALEKKKLIGNKYSIAISLNNIGLSSRKLGEFDKALGYHLEALKLNLELNNKVGLSLTYSNLGLIYKESGKLDEALEYTKKSLELREELQDKQGISIQRLILGTLYRELGEYSNAGEEHAKSIEIAKNMKFKPILKDNYFELALLYKEEKVYKKALEYFEKYSGLRDSLMNEEKSKKIIALQTKYETEKNLSRIQGLELERQTTLRNFLLVIFGLILVSIGLVYSRGKVKARALKTIKETEEFNTALISQLPEYVLVHKEGKIVYTNSLMSEALGFEPEELKGRSVYDFLDQKYVELVKQKYLKRIQGEELEDYEVEIIHKNGQKRFVIVKASVINFKNEQSVLAVLIDISERKKNEVELLKAKEEAEESNRLKSEFLAQMSHEIRSPINTILNFTYLIKDEIELNKLEAMMPAYESIQSASTRVIRTIDLILNMSQLQIGSYEISLKEFDLYKDSIYPIYGEVKSKASDKGIKLTVNKNADNTILVADEYSVSQIFVNLIENAIKYTKLGSVTVDINRDDKSRLVVEVKDTGIGISDNYLSRLFEPFTQEEQGYTREYEGTGLGLALVKRYCELNNAEINVSSSKGKGTVFKVIFS